MLGPTASDVQQAYSTALITDGRFMDVGRRPPLRRCRAPEELVARGFHGTPPMPFCVLRPNSTV